VSNKTTLVESDHVVSTALGQGRSVQFVNEPVSVRKTTINQIGKLHCIKSDVKACCDRLISLVIIIIILKL